MKSRWDWYILKRWYGEIKKFGWRDGEWGEIRQDVTWYFKWRVERRREERNLPVVNITYGGDDTAEIAGHHQRLDEGEVTHAEQKAARVRQNPVHIAPHGESRQAERQERSSDASLRLTTLCPDGGAVRGREQSLIRVLLRSLTAAERGEALRFQTLSRLLTKVRERFDGCEAPFLRHPTGTRCHPQHV